MITCTRIQNPVYVDAFHPEWSLVPTWTEMNSQMPNNIPFELTSQMTDCFSSMGETAVYESSFESPEGQSDSSCIDDSVWPHPEMELRCLREAYTQQLHYIRDLEARYSNCTRLVYLKQQLVADLQGRLLAADCQKAAVSAQLEEMERGYTQMKEEMKSHMSNIA